jgi:hypothetical protein
MQSNISRHVYLPHSVTERVLVVTGFLHGRFTIIISAPGLRVSRMTGRLTSINQVRTFLARIVLATTALTDIAITYTLPFSTGIAMTDISLPVISLPDDLICGYNQII